MEKLVCAHLLFLLSIATLITSVHASVTVQAIIKQDVHIVFNLENINSTIYWAIKNENLIDESTIPNIILDNLEQQNLTYVDVYTQPTVFNDPPASSIYVAFSLTGSDILNSTVNTKSMTKTCHVRTDWRRFQINLKNGFSLNFNEYFDKPVDEWQRINYTLNDKTHPAYYYNFTDSNIFDPECYFILPAAATNVQVVRDLITFELSLSFEDSLLNSPFLILGALIVVIVAFSLYRKVRK